MQETMFDKYLRPVDEVKGRTRRGDYATSKAGARAVSFRAGTQKALLLRAFADAGPSGLSDDEAAQNAGLSPTSCYWKRCGELRAVGLIQFTGEERQGSAGVDRMVSTITAAGETALEGAA
jgi:hypothetical protein